MSSAARRRARSRRRSTSRPPEDLLRHYPRRYYERGELDRSLGVTGRRAGHAAGPGRRRSRPARSGRSSHKTDITVTDGTGTLLVTFFNRRYLAKTLPTGRRDRAGRRGRAVQARAAAQAASRSRWTLTACSPKAGMLMPVYPATRALADLVDPQGDPGGPRHGRRCRRPCRTSLRDARGLIGLDQALRWVHALEDRRQVGRAVDRLRFDEAFVLQVVLAQRRRLAALEPATPRVARDRGLLRGVLTRQPPVPPHRGSARGRCAQLADDLAHPVPAAPVAAGRGGLGKDGRGAAGDAHRGGRRRPGRAARPDRGARPAAREVD